MSDTYFDRFFDEKDIDPDGVMMSYGVVIAAIKQTSGEEAATIEAMLRKLDFHNADVCDYLRHLGMALAESVVSW